MEASAERVRRSASSADLLDDAIPLEISWIEAVSSSVAAATLWIVSDACVEALETSLASRETLVMLAAMADRSRSISPQSLSLRRRFSTIAVMSEAYLTTFTGTPSELQIGL